MAQTNSTMKSVSHFPSVHTVSIYIFVCSLIISLWPQTHLYIVSQIDCGLWPESHVLNTVPSNSEKILSQAGEGGRKKVLSTL